MGRKTKSREALALLTALAAIAVIVVLTLPSRPAITHNFLADINARALETPPEDRAWPRLYRAMLSMEPIPESFAARRWPFTTSLTAGTPPTPDEWAAAAAFLRANEQHLAALREAAGMPTIGIVLSDIVDPGYARAAADARGYDDRPESPSDNPPSWMILLPHLGEMRQAARLLAVDAILHAERGAFDRAAENIRAMLGMRSQLAGGFSLIEQLTGVAIELMAHKTLSHILAPPNDSLTPDALDTLESALADATDLGVTLDLAGERASLHDLIQRTYSAAGRMTRSGARLLTDMQGFGEVDADAARRIRRESVSRDEVIALSDRLFDASRDDLARPHWEREHWERGRVWQQATAGLEPEAFEVLRASLGSTNTCANRLEQLRQRRDASRAIIALTRHRLRHGEFPPTLDAIDDDLLSSPPIDRFSGQPLRWVLDDERATLYSVGNDRDDDLGVPIQDPKNLSWIAVGDTRSGRGGLQDGDWVLWRANAP